MTQKQLADSLFVTESAVSKWERGLSYPDISLVASICQNLKISEHELITASDDYQQIKLEKEARGYRRILTTYSWVFYLAYGITLVTCFICNLAIQHKLSWYFIVLTSLMVAFSLTNLPVIVKKNKSLWTLISFIVSLILLLFTCCIYTGGDWFIVALISILFGLSVVFLPFVLKMEYLESIVKNNKTIIYFIINSILLILTVMVGCIYSSSFAVFVQEGLPITLFCIIYAWILMVVIRYIRVNYFFKTSICLFLSSIWMLFTNSFIDMIIEKIPFKFLEFDFNYWNFKNESMWRIINGNIIMIIVISLALLGFAFAIGGIMKGIKNKDA